MMTMNCSYTCQAKIGIAVNKFKGHNDNKIYTAYQDINYQAKIEGQEFFGTKNYKQIIIAMTITIQRFKLKLVQDDYVGNCSTDNCEKSTMVSTIVWQRL